MFHRTRDSNAMWLNASPDHIKPEIRQTDEHNILISEFAAVIDKKYQHLVFAFFMALLMSCFMSLVISIFNVGFVSHILTIWLNAWGFAFVVAFPTITLVIPVVRKMVNLVITD